MTRQTLGRIGLIGDPVAHSLSPVFQQAAFDALGIPLRYELLHTPANQLDERVIQLRSGEFTGANVTVPHKEFFFNVVDERSEVTERVGAVNTIRCNDGLLYGDNTDAYGFAAPLIQDGFAFKDSLAVILGAGGAARAVIVALLDHGIRQLIITNRTPERAERLVTELGDPRLSAGAIDSAVELAHSANLVVNATSIGWDSAELPVDAALFTVLSDGAIAYDLTYRQTSFLNEAQRQRLHTIDGLPMLVHQGARSFEVWTGQPAPVDVMLDAVRQIRR